VREQPQSRPADVADRPCFPTVIALQRYRRAGMPFYVCASSEPLTGAPRFRKLKTLRGTTFDGRQRRSGRPNRAVARRELPSAFAEAMTCEVEVCRSGYER
jgi:hypothetical protein